MNDHWRAAFPRGCRVVLDLEALAAATLPAWASATGTVLGYSRDRDVLWIQFDGRTSRKSYHVRFVRRLEEPACSS
jgi:hypothetical protein